MRANETTTTQITIGSLFSGIGGLELGLEAAGLGPVLWQVEKDPFCRSILAKRWPDVDRYTDVRDVGGVHAIDCDLDGYCFAQGDCSGVLQSVDLICGGFPCQDVSHPGRRAGIEGTQSGLWFEMQRIICELRPRFVCVETAQGSLLEVSELSSADFPRSGTTRSGSLFALTTLVHLTVGRAPGSWPTPTASDSKLSR